MTGPASVVNQLMDAINRADLDAAAALYEEDAVLVPQPGQYARGRTQVKEALRGFLALKAHLQSDAGQIIECGDLALYLSRWSIRGIDPTGQEVLLGGESTDILRRQADGRWLIAVDNPWGVQLLPSRQNHEP
jgi:uncharacterized protein (TIGR02246 family)